MAKKPSGAFRPKKDLIDDTVLDDETRRMLMDDLLRGKGGPRPTAATADTGAGPGLGSNISSATPSTLGGGGGGGGLKDGDLMSAMTMRLAQLERQVQVQRKELSELNMKLISATDHWKEEKNRRLKAEGEADAAIDELAQVHVFLQDYGLTWVGPAKSAPSSREVSPQQASGASEEAPPKSEDSSVPTAKFDLYSGDFKAPTAAPSSDAPLPQSTQTKAEAVHAGDAGGLPFDLNVLKRNAQKLSNVVGYQGIATGGPGGKSGLIKERDTVHVCVYSDGLCVNSGPFRPYGWALCDALLNDLLDGFFPYEFKDKYPDGFPIEIVDKSTEPCPTGFANKNKDGKQLQTVATASDHGYKPLSRESILKRLPQQYITPSGRLINVQKDVADFVGGTVSPSRQRSDAGSNAASGGVPLEGGRRLGSKPSEGTAGGVDPQQQQAPPAVGTDLMKTVHGGTNASAVEESGGASHPGETKVQVRMPGGQRVLLHMRKEDSVGTLKQELLAASSSFFQPATAFDLCTVLPRRTLSDSNQTLEAAGLFPSCSCYVMMVKSG